MFGSIFSALGTFTDGEIPFEILKSEGTSESQEAEIDPETGNVTMPEIDLGQVVEPMYPIFNLTAYLLVAFFILIAGGRVARVGIDMLKANLPDVKIIKEEIRNYEPEIKNVQNLQKEKKGFFRKNKN